MATRSILYRGYFPATHGQIIGLYQSLCPPRSPKNDWLQPSLASCVVCGLRCAAFRSYGGGPEYGLQQITRSATACHGRNAGEQISRIQEIFICLKAVAALGFESSFELARTLPVCCGSVGLW